MAGAWLEIVRFGMYVFLPVGAMYVKSKTTIDFPAIPFLSSKHNLKIKTDR